MTAHLAVVGGLVLLAILTVYRSFGEFGFYYDDWRFLQEAVQGGGVREVFPTRPLHQPLTQLVFGTVGFNPTVGYVLLAVALIASALALYWMMLALFPRRRALAMITALLYLLYPGDLSRTWITAGLTANRPAVLLALVSLAVLFTALRTARRRRQAFRILYVTSMFLYLMSLMLYEAQALLVPALAFSGVVWIARSDKGLLYRNASRTAVVHAAWVSLPFLAIFGAVLAFRYTLLQAGAEDRFTATADFGPLYLARQLIGVYYFNFLEQPLEVLVNGLRHLGNLSVLSLSLTLAGAALVIGPVIYFAGRINRIISAGARNDRNALPPDTRFYRNLLVASLVITGVVYLILLPHDHIISASGLHGPFVSRLNAAGAIPVAISAASAFLFGLALARVRWPKRRSLINASSGGVLAASALLLVSYHGIVQDDYARAWEMQKHYVQQITAEMPDVPPGAHIHVIGVPAKHRSSYVFMYSLEHTLRLSYGESSITATSSPEFGGRYRVSRDGLFLDGGLVAEASNIWYFTLVSNECDFAGQEVCGQLVLSGPADTGWTDSESAVTGYRKKALDLLEVVADETTTTGRVEPDRGRFDYIPFAQVAPTDD